jgi:hypothetical protein
MLIVVVFNSVNPELFKVDNIVALFDVELDSHIPELFLILFKIY